MEWQRVLTQKTVYAQMVSNDIINSGCFKLHISQNVARSMPNLITQLHGDSMPAICLSKQEAAIYRPLADVKQASVKAYF